MFSTLARCRQVGNLAVCVCARACVQVCVFTLGGEGVMGGVTHAEREQVTKPGGGKDSSCVGARGRFRTWGSQSRRARKSREGSSLCEVPWEATRWL